MTRADRPPALLLDGHWWGTLAAARDLGARDVPIALASDKTLPPARWSRHVGRTLRCPDKSDPSRLLAWLLDFGRRFPGHVLYPTSDEVAWLVAANREALGGVYRLYSPPLEALIGLLDKHRLADAAREAGLEAPRTWCPSDQEEAARVAREAVYPVYVKSRTQVFAWGHGKGQTVGSASELVSVCRSWRGKSRLPPEVVERMPEAKLPLVQEIHGAVERIYTVDGLIDESGEKICTLGCVKILQWPRGSGPGICFESAPVPEEIEKGLLSLFRRAGFHGVFDAEFIEHGDRYLLIDVNPRFYNHMAFEVERGMPLPWLAYLGALGDRGGLRSALEAARGAKGGPTAYVHRLPMRLMLGLQALTGGFTREERRRWRAWAAAHEGRTTDPVGQGGDPGPEWGELVFELGRFLRHPRSYVRHLARPGPRPNGRKDAARLALHVTMLP